MLVGDAVSIDRRLRRRERGGGALVAAGTWTPTSSTGSAKGVVDAFPLPRSSPRWAALCGLAFVPYAAILHNVVFYPAQCMLNSFGHDYTLSVVLHWLARDPAPIAAVLLAVLTYHVGLRWPMLRQFLLPFLVAFLPLSLWVWDIPFSGRMICFSMHDMRLALFGDLALRTRHLYAFGAALFPVLVTVPHGAALRGTVRARVQGALRPLPPARDAA